MRFILFMLFIFVIVRIIVAVIDYRKEKKQHDENNKPDNGFFN